MTDACPVVDVPLLARTACIVTYGGSVKDIWINYITLLLTLMTSAWRAKRIVLSVRPDKVVQFRWMVVTTLSLIGLVFFQVALCWLVGCSGISIIWCAVAGWIINERKHHAQPADAGRPAGSRTFLDASEDLTLTFILVVLIYYAVTATFITSVAHFCALILGTLLSRGNRYCVLADSSHLYDTVQEEQAS